MRSLGTFILGIVVAIAAIVLAVFVVQNSRTGTYSFAGNSFSVSTGLLMLLAAALGFIIALLLVTPARMGHDRYAGELRRDNMDLAHELTGLRSEHQRLLDQHQRLQAERDGLVAERDGLRSERDTMRARLASVRETASAETAVPGSRYDPSDAAAANGATARPAPVDERAELQDQQAAEEGQAEQREAQPSFGDRVRGLFRSPDAPPPDMPADGTAAPTA